MLQKLSGFFFFPCFQVFDFTSPYPSSSCSYQLLLIDSLGTVTDTLTYCAANVTENIILEGSGNLKADGMMQLAFLRQQDIASGRLWLKVEGMLGH